ncbi:MAG: hypothetical protein AUK47_08075 [Deltaproteobacteria bacterium CG2_30_63_29]|nr:MAG: hypothetical protein AUK47_08075 [Deltaproteobacteria bacterium CG2_30_63_29]PJB42065.1 MAG: HAD family hydrolase [Deltaproteobacteria bacterium CG_4_9_14_3_um_filter_63_12]
MTKEERKRGLFCNRTLNLGGIQAIGYDMDYTLVHYDVVEWERCAYSFIKRKLLERGFPVEDLEYDSEFVTRGLVMDTELGNIVKANRFGYIKRACHSMRFLSHKEQRAVYRRAVVDLGESRWRFLNTFFSLSEACMFAQLVGLFDQKALPSSMQTYLDLYKLVRSSLDLAHMEGELKAMIVADPERFVELDPEIVSTLLDQRDAGKKLLLITNSGWPFTQQMMSYCVDRYLPDGMSSWRELFELVVVSARKPDFFLENQPTFVVTDASGTLLPDARLEGEALAYLGSDATQVEQYLGVDGSEILYVGDHIYSDVHVSKAVRRWRTSVIIRELESEVEAMLEFEDKQEALNGLMREKMLLEQQIDRLDLKAQRLAHGRPVDLREEPAERQALLDAIDQIDERVAPMARASSRMVNRNWGLLMRTGNDKSHLARQIERHADVYTSRVSNFGRLTPSSFLRSHRGTLPHD